MRKLISVFCVLMAAALIIAGAFLPRYVGAVMDQAAMEAAIGSAPMQSVALNLRDSTQTEDMARKLAMERRMYTVPVDASEASMTEDEVYAAVESCMADYVEAGIFEWFPYTTRVVEPFLGIDSKNIDNMAICWSVTYVNEKTPYQSLFLHVDDETGKILYLNYEDYSPDKVKRDSNSQEYIAWQQYVLDTFTGIYFEQLGLSDIQQYYDSNGLVEQEAVDGGVYLRRYLMGDSEYGECIIEFYTQPAGFYLFFNK